jgi:hypothetical protein
VYLFIAPGYLHHPRTFKRYLFFHSVDCHVLLSTDLTCILFPMRSTRFNYRIISFDFLSDKEKMNSSANNVCLQYV